MKRDVLQRPTLSHLDFSLCVAILLQGFNTQKNKKRINTALTFIDYPHILNNLDI